MKKLRTQYETGAFIRLRRKSLKLSQHALGRRVGTTGSAVSLWESGSSMPTGTHLLHLAKVLQVTPEEILTRSPGERSHADDNSDDENADSHTESIMMLERTIPVIPKAAIPAYLDGAQAEWEASPMLQSIAEHLKAGPRAFAYIESSPSLPWIPAFTPILIDPDRPIFEKTIRQESLFRYHLFLVNGQAVLGQLNATPSGMLLQFQRTDPGWEPIPVEERQYIGRFLACDFSTGHEREAVLSNPLRPDPPLS